MEECCHINQDFLFFDWAQVKTTHFHFLPPCFCDNDIYGTIKTFLDRVGIVALM